MEMEIVDEMRGLYHFIAWYRVFKRNKHMYHLTQYNEMSFNQKNISFLEEIGPDCTAQQEGGH